MRLVHLSDLHVGKTESEWPALLRLVDRVRAIRPDAVVISGDLVERPDDIADLRRVRELLDGMGIPYYAVPGNHDVQTPGQNAAFEADFGLAPRVERQGGAVFMLFDSFGGLAMADRTAEDHECFANTGCWLDGRVPDEQFDVMHRALSDDDRWRIAVVHHHLEPSPDAQVNALLNADEFVEWCAAHRVAFAFVGHLHETAAAVDVGGVMRLRIGRSTKAPFPLGVLDLETGAYDIMVESE